MFLRVAAFLMAAAALFGADKKIAGSARGENLDLALSVTLYLDASSVKELVGDELGGHFIVAEVKVEPKYGKEVLIDRDDFLLRSQDNGEKTTPMAPSQIAGRGALVVRQTTQGGGGGRIGSIGYPGGYPGGYPPVGYPPSGPPPSVDPIGMPGSGGGVAMGGGGVEGAEATVNNGGKEKENPLQLVLREKELPNLKKTIQPVSGLLYFAMEKQKLKNLELAYGGRENRITLRFK